MSKSVRRRSTTRPARSVVLRERELQRRALRTELRIQRELQRMTRQLNREIQRTNDRFRELAGVLGSHARAIEAEREADAALRS